MLFFQLVATLAAAHAAAAIAFRGAVGELPATAKRNIGFCTGNPAVVYRAAASETYNTDHFYTRSLDEITNSRVNYKREKDCCRVFAGPRQSNTTLVRFYRLLNRASRDHFYTIDLAERDAALATGAYDDQDILGWVQAAPDCASWPLFRLYHGGAFSTVDHFYTIDEAERDSAIASGKYVYEGIAAWVWPTCDIQPCSP